MRHPGRSDNSLIHTAFSPGCDKVAQKCVIRAQKCAIMRHLAQRSEPLGAQRRPHETAAAADGGDPADRRGIAAN
jgi:hypothetical protein